MPKSREKTRLVKQPHGGALKQGNTVGVGRPPDWLKRQADELLADPASWSQVENILKDNKHAAFHHMWKALADRAHGKPTESIELTGKDGGPVQVQEWSFGKRKVTF